MQGRFPIVITRSLDEARAWLRAKARGSERYGILCSSQAYRLKPHAIDVRAKIDPVHGFLDGKDDVRSSYYLEDAATEFQVQGLELDRAWERKEAGAKWPSVDPWEFKGSKWQQIKQASGRYT